MRRNFAATALVALLVAAPMVQAATMTNGAIKAFDLKAMTLTLDNGISYKLPAGFKDPGLKVGEKVTIAWAMKGADHDASAVTILK